jgi:D-beta-D-heptose 7-phosphate kinase/D-beta-D-heptose 1-phosphate adenosyltransferase
MKKIVVIGDVMIDRYYFSNVKRICPEAPIPIANVHNIQNNLGGAANLSLNIKNLLDNPNQLILVSVLGYDEESTIIEKLCSENNINTFFIKDKSRKTTVKNRIYSNEQMISRFDIEDTHVIKSEIQNEIMNYISTNLKNNIDYIVISDYNKGIFDDYFCNFILNYCEENNIYSFVDPKVNNYLRYQNSFLIKPNLDETMNIYSYIKNTNFDENYIQNNMDIILCDLYNHLKCKYIVCTCGKEGMILYSNLQKTVIKHKNIEDIIVKDVTGCGDVVFAVLITQFYKTNNLFNSVEVANYIGGLSVQNIGTYICNKIDIENFNKKEDEVIKFENKTLFFKNNENMIFNFVVNQIKKSKKIKNIVFTNGCFDIVHLGHLELLKYSKSLGDYLIVGLNSDSSIKRLKGDKRPIHNQDYRSKFLSFFDFIDLIIIFDDDTPFKLLEKIKPNILVKGGDYTLDKIIGKEFVDEVKIFNTIENYSSTNIISSINLRY